MGLVARITQEARYRVFLRRQEPSSSVATGLLPSQEHVMRWGCASSRFQAQSIEFRHALERRVACMMADRQRIIAAVEPPALPFLEPGDQARVEDRKSVV